MIEGWVLERSLEIQVENKYNDQPNDSLEIRYKTAKRLPERFAVYWMRSQFQNNTMQTETEKVKKR